MPKDFLDIPCIQAGPPSPVRSMEPFNPWAINAMLHQANESPIYRLLMPAADGLVESVWVNDERAAREILQDEKGIWRKGPQTFEPFSSLVPLHLIALEGPLHALMRSAAQTTLGDLVAEGTLPAIAKDVGARLVVKLRSVASAQNQTCWFAQLGKFQGAACAITVQVDRMFRAAALDIVSEAVFGQRWGSLDDYSSTNVLADTLGKVMYELHWRVVDLTKREWRRNSREEPAGSLLDVIDLFIESQIDLAVKRRAQEPKPCMLDSWVSNPALNRDQVRNLCWTFLTMGHENVASGLAWTLICLAQDEDAQQACRDGGKQDLETAFNEAVRLFPSVAGLTRTNYVETEILGYRIPRFTEVVVETYLLHRNQATWGPDAETFRPSRCPVVSTQGPPDAFPFGVGARSCVGRPLSLVELNNVVRPVVNAFRVVSLDPKDPTKRATTTVTPNNLVSLRPGLHCLAFLPLAASSKI